MNNNMTDIFVEVQALNLDGIKQNLLDFVETQAKIDIDDSVDKADKSAKSAENYAGAAAQSAIVANDCASQASASLGNYYTKAEINTALAGKANVATTLAGYGITDGANTALSNLNSNGQMIVDSQNGTISNCVLDIPQNIKVTLENNVLTLKTGSILTIPASVYTTVTTTQDFTHDYTGYPDGRYVVVTKASGRDILERLIGNCVSGAGATTAGGLAYDTTANEIGYYLADGTKTQTCTYPFCIVDVVGGVAGFAKDSNGNAMIFNGAGFIGTALFCFPNVKGLIPNGLNANGTYKSEIMISNAVRITQLAAFNGDRILLSNSLGGLGVLYDLTPELGGYNANKNLIYRGSGTVISQQVELGEITMSSSIVTDFTIRQPVRTATVEMLNSALGDVETLLAAI